MADALSCRIDSELDGIGKATHLSIILFKPGQLQMNSNMELVLHDTIQITALQMEKNPWAKEILEVGMLDDI